MILVIRGHIRNSFNNKDLYLLVKEIDSLESSDLSIYIHTWNIVANNLSWRSIDTNALPVTKEHIYDYFSDLKDRIKEIIIDDDTKIKLIGNLNGKINGGPAPIVGWKNYWYSKYQIINHIYTSISNNDEIVVNTRFDILNNSVSFNRDQILLFIQSHYKLRLNKNVFTRDEEYNGCDNIYIGTINTMYKLTDKFFYSLDEILDENTDTRNQERLVYRINKQLFN
jgi:hypothetical protein